MKVSVTGRGVTVQDSFKEYAEQKARKLERYADSLQKIEILLSSQGDDKVVEMIVVPRRGDRVVGHTQHEDAFAAVDLVVDKMYAQLSKLKKKRQDRNRSERVPPPLDATDMPPPPAEDDSLESYQEVVDKFSEKLDE